LDWSRVEETVRTRRLRRTIIFLLSIGILFVGISQETFSQSVADKSQVSFQKDSAGYVFLAPGVNLKSYDMVVIGNFSIERLPDIGPGKLEELRDAYRNHLRSKLTAAGIFKEVTDDISKASGSNTLIVWGDFLTMNPGSAAARFG
jgi:hypothetical protein